MECKTRLLEINKSYVKKEVEKHIDSVFNELQRRDKRIERILDKLAISEKNRVILARAYANKLNVLVNLKTYESMYGKKN